MSDEILLACSNEDCCIACCGEANDEFQSFSNRICREACELPSATDCDEEDDASDFESCIVGYSFANSLTDAEYDDDPLCCAVDEGNGVIFTDEDSCGALISSAVLGQGSIETPENGLQNILLGLFILIAAFVVAQVGLLRRRNPESINILERAAQTADLSNQSPRTIVPVPVGTNPVSQPDMQQEFVPDASMFIPDENIHAPTTPDIEGETPFIGQASRVKTGETDLPARNSLPVSTLRENASNYVNETLPRSASQIEDDPEGTNFFEVPILEDSSSDEDSEYEYVSPRTPYDYGPMVSPIDAASEGGHIFSPRNTEAGDEVSPNASPANTRTIKNRKSSLSTNSSSDFF
eukprot:augustus_masked-scaffold_43-processed-gene-0.43-mRNA-1 protein AED:1.00 eAED:1.00 QI:0/-1/0/0/-1/1/1/0/350